MWCSIDWSFQIIAVTIDNSATYMKALSFVRVYVFPNLCISSDKLVQRAKVFVFVALFVACLYLFWCQKIWPHSGELSNWLQNDWSFRWWGIARFFGLTSTPKISVTECYVSSGDSPLSNKEKKRSTLNKCSVVLCESPRRYI